MARKLRLTRDQKIKGLRKALANPRTPKQFKPSLRKRLAALTLIFLALAIHGNAQSFQRPNPSLTPGVASHLTKEQICATKWGKDARHVTATMKAQVYAEYRAKKVPGKCCEIDHLISREIGGADDIRNLWPQPWSEAHQKDYAENWAHKQVCAGKLDLAVAQKQMAQDWTVLYRQYLLEKHPSGGNGTVTRVGIN